MAVLGDIPPLAFAAAQGGERAARSALGNFSWDWIYAHLAKRQPGFADAAAWARAAYGSAAILLRLPFAGDLAVFQRVEDIPLVARRPRLEKGEARRRLGLDERPAILLSFGGIGVPGLKLEAMRSDRRLPAAAHGPGARRRRRAVARALARTPPRSQRRASAIRTWSARPTSW